MRVDVDIDKINAPNAYEILKDMPQEQRNEYATDMLRRGYLKDQREQKRRALHIIDNLDQMNDVDDKVYMGILKEIDVIRQSAKRFVFDDEASTHLGNFIREERELWMNNPQFALPPYENTYIQCNVDNVIKAIGHGSTADKSAVADATRDLDTGYLISEKVIFPMVRGVESSPKGRLGLFAYEMYKGDGCTCRPIFNGSPMMDDADDRDHTVRAMLLLGSSYNGLKMEEYIPFLHTVRIHLNIDEKRYNTLKSEKRKNNQWNIVLSSAGDYRIGLAALFLLNQQKHVQTVHVPNNSMLIGGKRRVVHSHSRVVIRLQNFDVIRRSLGNTLVTPRMLHDVRGHFRNVHVLKGCEHDWEDLSDRHGITRWACKRCKGLRTTVRPHKRGDASIGVLTSAYDVKE
jgi:uncharacterized protein YnzC (UPF0291/DUF896 family)